jgi:carbonic anhydrase/acetyltransferase-like protein (isoleucine patch superfamily)
VIHAYRGVVPKVDPSAWIAESVDVIADEELGKESSVWIYISLAADYRAASAA